MSNLLCKALDKAATGQRLNREEALALFREGDLLTLADLARKAKLRLSGKYVYFNVNTHINLTNICTAQCPLCAFCRTNGDKDAYDLNIEQVLQKIEQDLAGNPDITEIHIVSALHPTKPYSYYLEIITAIKQNYPNICIKAFTPVEIAHFASISNKNVNVILAELQEAGLEVLPGGGAEILEEGIRRKICPNKASSQAWVNVVEIAHKLGIKTNASMLYGHIETVEQRVDHLLKLREIQDKTGGFQAYVGFPFHPQNTRLSELQQVTAWENLKMIALARLILDNIAHSKAFWMMLTLPIAQLALAFGADDLDGTVTEERIIHAAGAKTAISITRNELVDTIAEAGYVPVERDSFYQHSKVYSKE